MYAAADARRRVGGASSCPLILKGNRFFDATRFRENCFCVGFIFSDFAPSVTGGKDDFPGFDHHCAQRIATTVLLSGLARANGFGDETRICNVNNLRGVELATGRNLTADDADNTD